MSENNKQKIESLTSEQEVNMIQFRESCRLKALSTDRIDLVLFTSVINDFYKRIDKKEPIIWVCDSPLQAQIYIHLFKNKLFDFKTGESLDSNLYSNLRSNLGSNLGSNLYSNLRSNLGNALCGNLNSNLYSNLESNLWSNLRSNLRSNLWSNLWSNLESNLENNLESNLGNNLWDNLRNNLWSNLRCNLRNNLYSNLGSNLCSNLWDNLYSNLNSNLGSNLWDNLWDNLRNTLSNTKIEYEDNYFLGNMEMGWIAYYLWPHENLRAMYSDDNYVLLQQWFKLACSCSWWWPFENIVFVSDRPVEQHFDSEYKLHNLNAPAIRYRDNYSLYAIHGNILEPLEPILN